MIMQISQNITLNNGIKMPRIGFGVFQMTDLLVCERAVINAIGVGYRLIDTASSYQNEEAVGNAIRKSGVNRQDLFITTKAFVHEMGYENTKEAFECSCQKIGTNYLDLYLIHMPYSDYYGAWRAMEELYQAGRIRAIGVCNFLPDRLIDFCENVKIIPAINQIEIHPFYQREDERLLMKTYDIQPEAWAPFAEGMNNMFSNPILLAIAKTHRKTVAQIVLRWNLQCDNIVISKTVHQERMIENISIWDFELTQEEMQKITALDLKRPQMLDTRMPSEVRRIYNYLKSPILTSLSK